MKRVDDPAELAALFGSDRETHVYGLADLEEPFWSHSSWYRDGPAVVGLVSTGNDWVTGYAMSRSDPEATLDLLAEVLPELPSGNWITGPMGMAKATAKVRKIRPIGSHWRMVLSEPVATAGSSSVVRLNVDDLNAVLDLHASDPDRSFFLPMMLDNFPFCGIWEDGRLVASAGTHVASLRHGVAAVGAVITRPSHRGRGLGAQVIAALCERLAGDYETIGLNVEVANDPALRLYNRLGFRRVFQYEEIEAL